MLKIPSKELLRELKVKFNKNQELINEHAILMEQLKLVNDKLINSERVKSNFLSNIRNEINNPISGVLELSRSLLSNDLSKTEINYFSQLIYNEVFYLEFQLRNIFTSAEIEAGEIKLSPSVVNTRSVLMSILESFRHLTEKRGLNVELEFNSNDVSFATDPEKLHLIVSNLVANAVRFCNENGTIRINLSIDNGVFELRVKNSGSSILESNRSIVFDRFKQMEEGTRKPYIGHGLGLSVTRALVDLLNGEIKLNSDLKEGTEFLINLNVLKLDSNTVSEDGNDFLFEDLEENVF